MTNTHWQSVANSLISDCPSHAIRNATVAILHKVELIGPLLGPQRGPTNEFRRVYRFLTYNEPTRIMAVVDERIAAFQRGGCRPLAKFNAWNYVVGAFDLWLSRARVFYTATGLIEGALRARLDARMTDTYGPTWPQNAESIPSPVRPLATQDTAQERLNAIRRLIDDRSRGNEESATRLLDAVQSLLILQPVPALPGALFVSSLDFGALRNFFQAQRLWNRGPKLETLFRNPTTGKPPLRSEVDSALGIIHEVRNEVAHYRRPAHATDVQSRRAHARATQYPPSFTKGLYGLSRLARWMGVDLQHFYSSVDTRHTPELSLLIEDPMLLNSVAPENRFCANPNCKIGEPLDLLLRYAPIDGTDLTAGNGMFACLYHRIELRTTQHRPAGE